MAWAFVRGGNRLRCETRARGPIEACELVVMLPGGATQVEHYPTRAALLRRQFELIRAWKAQGWREVESDADLAEPSRAGRG